MARIDRSRGKTARNLLSLRQRPREARAVPERSDVFRPVVAINFRTEEFCRPKYLAIRLAGTLTSRGSQIVVLSSSENRGSPTPPNLRHQKFANQGPRSLDRSMTRPLYGWGLEPEDHNLNLVSPPSLFFNPPRA
jgi:hypothetical protein